MRRLCNYLPFLKGFRNVTPSLFYIPKVMLLSELPKPSLSPAVAGAMRPYCSQMGLLDLEHKVDGRGVRNIHFNKLDADKLYATVMGCDGLPRQNGNHYRDMEKDLDQLGLELTTDLVVDILSRLHFEEKIAFRFFMWAGRQENYAHEPCAYNEMIEILSSTKYKVKQFRIVCDMLDYMKRSNKNVVPVEVLLTILRNYTQKYLTHVQKFAKKKRIRVKTQPEINALNFLLDALCKCCLVEDAEALLKRMKKTVKPDANTYNILFFGWCRVRNPTRGMKTLEEMIQLGHTPDCFTYNTAIDSFCKAGMVNEAVELFEFMRTQGSTMSSPTAKTYAIIVVALVQNDRIDDSFKLLGHMINSGCLPDVSTYQEMIEGMCLAGKIDEAYKFLEEMGNKGYPPDILTYNCFLKVLCETKKSDEALRLYRRMIEMGCIPSVQTYNMFISMFFEVSDPDGAFDTWHEMDTRVCAKDVDTYTVMIDGLFGCNKAKDACCLIEELVDKGMKLPYRRFDSFLMQLSINGNLPTIHKLSEHMRRFYNPSMARRFALNEKRKSMSYRGRHQEILFPFSFLLGTIPLLVLVAFTYHIVTTVKANMDFSLWDGALSQNDFNRSAHTFAERWKRSNSSLPPWLWISCRKGALVASQELEGYLSLENICLVESSQDNHTEVNHTGREDTDFTYNDEEIDDATLVQNTDRRVHYYEFHIVYSASYRVPVLYFRAYYCDGQPIPLNEVEKDLPARSTKVMLESKWTFITQEEHPYLNRPWYKLHPCGTSEWMKLLFLGDAALAENKLAIELYVMSWFSVVGQVFGLRIPIEMVSNRSVN
ncbi:hypothetical protein Tsubulata_008733 [Turnera subulata]|uniref:Uncharacterized protein n=1 Tax=Turnera subulata TaxID=218843 RepID=A0A9Q0G453_9ROSI|nr:hypothetical protein Tsubulata_008733 [Turnera subulata]